MTDLTKMKIKMPAIITDRYELKGRIGKGGMGHVYLAEDLQLMRKVAIKTISPEFLENDNVLKRIERECKMHAAIRSHPHIVALYDKITYEKNIFLIMEYVKGKTLSELISIHKLSRQEISAEFIVTIILQLLDALGCIHRHDIIHRDIKPSNIIVGGLDSNIPYAKLMDFGIARDILEDENLTKLTMLDSGGPGTPAYMSPERFDSTTFGDISPATDLYAVGIILYELFHKDPPFHGTMTEVFSGHLARDPEFSDLDFLPEPIKFVLSKSLQKKPEDRYREANEFAVDLETASLACSDKTLLTTSNSTIHGKCILDTPYSPPHKTNHRKNKTLFLIIAATFTLVILGGVYFITFKMNYFSSKVETQIKLDSPIPSHPAPIELTSTKTNTAPEQPPAQNESQQDINPEQEIDVQETTPTQNDSNTSSSPSFTSNPSNNSNALNELEERRRQILQEQQERMRLEKLRQERLLEARAIEQKQVEARQQSVAPKKQRHTIIETR